MNPLSLRTTKAIEKLESSDIEKAGDYCITHVPMYNSDKQTYAIVLKCPYCAMDMMSTRIHRINISRLKRFLSKLGLPFGVTVKPKLTCPYNPSHSFSITNGRISAVK